MGQIFFDRTFAHIVVYCEGLDCRVVYDDFFYAVFLTLGKLIIIQAYGSGIPLVVGVAEQKIDAPDCAQRKKRNAGILEKHSCAERNHKGELKNLKDKIECQTDPRHKAVFHKQQDKKHGRKKKRGINFPSVEI